MCCLLSEIRCSDGHGGHRDPFRYPNKCGIFCNLHFFKDWCCFTCLPVWKIKISTVWLRKSQVTRFVFKLWNPVDILNAKLFSRMPSAYSFHSKGCCFSHSSIFSLKHQKSLTFWQFYPCTFLVLYHHMKKPLPHQTSRRIVSSVNALWRSGYSHAKYYTHTYQNQLTMYLILNYKLKN